MANITFTIKTENLPYFIDYYSRDYDQLVLSGEIDGNVVSKSEYARDQAFKHLASPVRKWHRQKQAELIADIDITEQ